MHCQFESFPKLQALMIMHYLRDGQLGRHIRYLKVMCFSQVLDCASPVIGPER
jgi:hypothetical protein